MALIRNYYFVLKILNKAHKKQKMARKFFAWFSILSLVLQTLSGILLYQPVYSQELSPTPTPTIETTPTPDASLTPEVSPTPTETITPTDTPTPTDQATPTPSVELSPTPTNEATPTPTAEEASPTPQDSAPTTPGPPQESQVSPEPTQLSPTPSINPSPSPEPKVEGQLAAVILANTDAASVAKLDLDPQTASSATLVTDKADYAPTDSVLVNGSGFIAGQTYILTISSGNEPPVNFETQVTTNNKGEFIYTYQLDGNYRPNYKVEAKDSVGNIVATVTFTDSSNTNLDQYANSPTNAWQNGNLNSGNHSYREGDSVPFRLDITGLSSGPHTIHLNYDFSDGSKRGYDFLTNFDRTVAPNPCSGKPAICGTYADASIPTDSDVSSFQIAGNVRVFNAASASLGTYSLSAGKKDIILTFSTTNSEVIVAWGGHLASPVNWGAGNGASSFPGGSLHMRTQSLDGGGGNNQDRSIQTNGIIELASVTVIKVVDGGSATADQWGFNISPNPNSETLPKYPASGQSTVTFLGLPTGSYQITETSLSGYSFASGSGTNCTFVSSTATANVTAATTATNASCTFHNAQQKGTVIVHKDVQGPNGEAITDTSNNFTVNLDGSNPQSIADNGTVTYNDVLAGAHTVNESVVPSGYTLYNMTPDSDAGTTGAQITVTASQTTNVYIINRQQQTKLTLTKTVINNNGGIKVVSDFVLKIDGNQVTSGVANNVTPGSHTASEVNLAGYTASSWGGDCNTDGTITLALGANKTCTITNDDIQPKLTVTKIVTNDNGGTKQVSDFPLFVDQTSVTSGVQNGFNAGTYTVSETQDPGYEATISGACASNGSITLNIGDVKSCTITNNDKAAHLIVIKHVVNDNGGNAVASNFTMTINGVTATGGNSFPGAESPGTNKTLTGVGSYNVTETGPNGYSPSTSADCSGTIALGDTKTCTITNDDITPTITLIKNVINNNGGNAGANDFGLTVGGTPVNSGQTLDVNSNTAYAINEAGLEGYSFVSITGDSKCPQSLGESIMLNEGEEVTCTITNDDKASTITLVKDVVNDDGGTAGNNDFGLKIGDTDVDSGQTLGVEANTDYAIDEEGLDGYQFISIEGEGCPEELGDTVNLNEGEDLVCTITNNDIAPTLTLVKEVINNNGGTALPTDWTLSADGSERSFSGTSPVQGTVTAGVPYTLSETGGPFGYTPSAWECNGGNLNDNTVTLDVGENITCTITNDDQPGSITVEKITDPESDQSFTFNLGGESTQSKDIFGGESDTFSNLEPGVYTLSEADQAGWDLTNAVCDNESFTNGGELTITSGKQIYCTFTNTERGTITGFKWNDLNGNGRFIEEGEPKLSDWHIQLFTNNDGLKGQQVGDDQVTDQVGNYTFSNVVPGDYFICEVLQAGWKQTYPDFDSRYPNCWSVTVEPGDEQTGKNFGNQVEIPILTISKTNDTGEADRSPGSSILFTITVIATQSAVKNVQVTDLLPDGFKYQGGSWTSDSTVRGDLKASSITTEPTYASPGVWKLGDMIVDEKVTLTYVANISGDQHPGLYYDVAWAQGTSLTSTQILANAINPGFVDDNFVGTQVNIVKDTQSGININIERKEEGQVLGAATLPATGAQTMWLVIALILLTSGLGAIITGHKIKRHYE